MGEILKALLILLITNFLSLVAWAEKTPRDREVFVRKCYAQLTSQRIQPDSEFLERAKTGEDPVSICMDILDLAKLDSSGKISANQVNGIGAEVLNNMHNLHSNFFTNREFNLHTTQATRTTSNYFDFTQPAYYITKSLFADNWTYDKAITTETSLQAIRTNNNPDQLIWNSTNRRTCAETDQSKGCARLIPKFYNPNSPVSNVAASGLNCLSNPSPASCRQYKAMMDFNNLFAPTGKLIGIQNHPGVIAPHGFFQFQGGEQLVTDHKNGAKNLGAGIIGDPVFVMSNDTNVGGYKANGASSVPRSWAKAVYEDVLCRQLPALRPSDVGFLQTDNPQAPSFRNSTSCLRCHSGMDQTAGVIRNLQYLYSSSVRSGHYAFISVRLRPWTISSNEAWRETNDSSWYQKTPFGRLLYRDYEGKLIHQSVNNMQQLGKAISETDDYYLCAAKNYYRHFVNVDLALADPKSPNYVEDAKEHKEELIRIGLKFKEHKSLRLLIEDIFASKLYFAREGN